MEKTKEYDLFIFRDDNRNGIDQAHVKRLMESIKSRNLLNLRPIEVNEKYEIMDGQHRLLAAKNLGVEIYYIIRKNAKPEDIILMNINKNWTPTDFLNYYCKNQFPEYLKLKKFMDENRINITIASKLTSSTTDKAAHEFKTGNYKFNDQYVDGCLDICWDTIEYVKKMNGYSPYLFSSRFWRAMVKLIKHDYFERDKWMNNLQKNVDKFSARANHQGYLRIIMDVYNWRNNNKIDLMVKEE